MRGGPRQGRRRLPPDPFEEVEDLHVLGQGDDHVPVDGRDHVRLHLAGLRLPHDVLPVRARLEFGPGKDARLHGRVGQEGHDPVHVVRADQGTVFSLFLLEFGLCHELAQMDAPREGLKEGDVGEDGGTVLLVVALLADGGHHLVDVKVENLCVYIHRVGREEGRELERRQDRVGQMLREEGVLLRTRVSPDLAVELLRLQKQVLEEGEGLEEGVVGNGGIELQNTFGINCLILAELRALDQSEDDRVLLPDQGAANAVQGHDVCGSGTRRDSRRGIDPGGGRYEGGGRNGSILRGLMMGMCYRGSPPGQAPE